jgi:Asp-tRNA(Asn)/Glu-tRNA(Gln) amidotransferase A subunit family amidase
VDFDEYRKYDATGLARLVADKHVSAAELLAVATERAAAVNPRLNAMTTVRRSVSRTGPVPGPAST